MQNKTVAPLSSRLRAPASVVQKIEAISNAYSQSAAIALWSAVEAERDTIAQEYSDVGAAQSGVCVTFSQKNGRTYARAQSKNRLWDGRRTFGLGRQGSIAHRNYQRRIDKRERLRLLDTLEHSALQTIEAMAGVSNHSPEHALLQASKHGGSERVLPNGGPQPGDTIAVWFSCGAASAVAAKKTIERYGEHCTIRVINTPVAEEDADNRRFLKDVEKWLGHSIEIVTHSKHPNSSAVEVWDKKQAMSFIHGAPCTTVLKKEARQEWENANNWDWLVLGFTADEINRSDRFMLTERANLLPVLIESDLAKKDCFAILQKEGLELPALYLLGYPNANCIGCVKSSSPTYWNHVRKVHPAVFADRAKQSRRLGAKLVRAKGERIFLDTLDPEAMGRPLKNLLPSCSAFCEES